MSLICDSLHSSSEELGLQKCANMDTHYTVVWIQIQGFVHARSTLNLLPEICI